MYVSTTAAVKGAPKSQPPVCCRADIHIPYTPPNGLRSGGNALEWLDIAETGKRFCVESFNWSYLPTTYARRERTLNPDKIKQMFDDALTKASLAKQLYISRMSVYRS